MVKKHYSIAKEVQALSSLVNKHKDKPSEKSVSAFVQAGNALRVLHQSKTEIACGAEEGEAVSDAQDVTCPKCQAVIDQVAQAKDDPIVRATILHKDLQEGQDFNFRYEGVSYHGVSGAIHRIPKSVVKWLTSIAVPQKKYREGQEQGMSMTEDGVRHRYMATIIEEMGAGAKTPPLKKAKKATTKKAFEIGNKVSATYDDGNKYEGEVTGLADDDGLYEVSFPDGDVDRFAPAELSLIAS